MERAVPILPADDIRTAKDFYVTKLGFTVVFEVSDGGKTGMLGLERGGIRITIDSAPDPVRRDADRSTHGQDPAASTK